MAEMWCVVPFSGEYVPSFLALAETEGWICDPWEFDFLRSSLPQGCFCLKINGQPSGFITSISYGRSGWIGNLIVAPDARGKGFGTLLMNRAINALEKAGTKTIWLTASAAGEAVYKKLGFAQIDTISRWRTTAEEGEAEKGDPYRLSDLVASDASVWGEPRDALIAVTSARGAVKVSNAGFLVWQPCNGHRQIGPWVASSVKGACELLRKALRAEAKGMEVFLDAPDANSAIKYLLAEAGFMRTAQTSLMYRGAEPQYEFNYLYGFASMGSMG